MTADLIPSERLRVFISSAQSPEGLLIWSEIRKRIKEYLKQCPYLNPFIIEDVASVMSSEQFYQRQLQKADIVVLLVKGEVRKGTATEFALATELKKPLMVYFLEEDNPGLSVLQLKQDLQTTDYCTYKAMKTFDQIEVEVFDDVIGNVIRCFQDMPLIPANNEKSSISSLSDVSIELSKISTPTKSAIAMFESCYNHIFDLLDLDFLKDKTPEEESTLHVLGIAALDWLVLGAPLKCDSQILTLIENAKDIYGSVQWLSKRWDAIRFELAGDVEKALTAAKQALAIAKGEAVSSWIINDILIDCRNLEVEICNRKRDLFAGSESQDELNRCESIVYLPVLDRYENNIYDDLLADEQKIKTASHNTVMYGSRFSQIIHHIENYFFAAMLYGSYTHMLLAREHLTKVLNKYGELTGKGSLTFESLKLIVVRGHAKEFKTTLDSMWDSIYLDVTSSSDDVWRLAENAPHGNRDIIKQAVMTKLGLYFSDSTFAEATDFIAKREPDIYWGNSEDYFECIYQNIYRLDHSVVTAAITNIIADKRFHLGRKVSSILMELQLKDVSIDLQNKLCAALEKQLTFIIRNNGIAQIIAALESQSPDVFSTLAAIPDNGLVGEEQDLYEINMGGGDWKNVLAKEVISARHQFEANKTPGQYIGFASLPHAMIQNIVNDHYNVTMNKILTEEYVPLCNDILRSETDTQIKNNCIDCLCDVLSVMTNNGLSIPKTLLQLISSLDASHGSSVFGTARGVFACRVLMLKIIANVSDKAELIEWCFNYNKKDTNERIALAECIGQYVRTNAHSHEKIDTTILSIVLQCLEDENYVVRMRACKCLGYMLPTQHHNWIERKLYEVAIDPSDRVRNHLLRMCREGNITDNDIKQKLLEIFCKDANFALREMATKVSE